MHRTLLFCLLATVISMTACREKPGTLRVINSSNNPYNIIVSTDPAMQVPGNTSQDIELDADTYQVRAEQVSGFLLYPTNLNATHTVSCESVTEWKIP
jgi:hypothetical protein